MFTQAEFLAQSLLLQYARNIIAMGQWANMTDIASDIVNDFNVTWTHPDRVSLSELGVDMENDLCFQPGEFGKPFNESLPSQYYVYFPGGHFINPRENSCYSYRITHFPNNDPTPGLTSAVIEAIFQGPINTSYPESIYGVNIDKERGHNFFLHFFQDRSKISISTQCQLFRTRERVPSNTNGLVSPTFLGVSTTPVLTNLNLGAPQGEYEYTRNLLQRSIGSGNGFNKYFTGEYGSIFLWPYDLAYNRIIDANDPDIDRYNNVSLSVITNMQAGPAALTNTVVNGISGNIPQDIVSEYGPGPNFQNLSNIMVSAGITQFVSGASAATSYPNGGVLETRYDHYASSANINTPVTNFTQSQFDSITYDSIHTGSYRHHFLAKNVTSNFIKPRATAFINPLTSNPYSRPFLQPYTTTNIGNYFNLSIR